MFLVAVVSALGLVASGCSDIDEGSLAAQAEASPVTATAATGRARTTSEPDPQPPIESDTPLTPPTSVPDEQVAGALVTSNGFVLPLIERQRGGYLVMDPCGDEVVVSGGTMLFEADVVLDPGHGGDVETGTVGANGLVEKDLNLRIAKRAARELTERGYVVVLTRTGDYRLPLEVRATIANQLDASVLVSIHHNAPTPAPASQPGTEVFTQTGSAESRRLGGLIWEELTEALATFADIEWAAAPDAGVLRVVNAEGDDSYGMVRRPEMPAVLAEFGYLSNPTEAALFATPRYVEASSVALADALERWLETDDVGGGLRAEARRFTPDGSTGHSRGCTSPLLE